MRQIVNILRKMSVFGLLSGLILLNSMPASAAVVDHLYEAEIAVTDQTRKTRHEVFTKAFQQTLIKVVGSSEVLGNPLINDARNNQVLKYISQFRYLDLPQDFKQPAAAETDPNVKAFSNILWIKFDVQAISRLLQTSHLPVWGKQRPETLVWIAVRDGGQRYILRERDKSPIKDEIEKSAKRRGLPIRWPDYNETERSRLSFLDIWGGFWDNILSVSRHYRKESMLVGRYLWTGKQWQVRWDVLTDQHEKYWQINSHELDLLAAEGVDKATDLVSVKYALFLQESEGGNFYIDIHGVNGVDRYAKIMAYLQNLAPVKDINASEINEQGIRFKISAQGGVDDLKRLIALDSVLLPVNVQVSTQQPAQGDVVLAYEMR